MKLKNILSGMLAVVFLFTTSGCKKILEEQPRASIDPSYFKTAEGVEGGIAGIYSSFRGL